MQHAILSVPPVHIPLVVPIVAISETLEGASMLRKLVQVEAWVLGPHHRRKSLCHLLPVSSDTELCAYLGVRPN